MKENKAKEYERFKRKFNLTVFAKDIATVLDEEPEVSRFYAELVPIEILPEEFWSRLFFRLHLLNRNGSASFEDDEEEEELVWEGEEEVVSSTTNDNMDGNSSKSISDQTREVLELRNRIKELEDENGRLKGQVKTLVSRISQLEVEVNKTKEPSSTLTTPFPSSANLVSLPIPSNMANIEDDARSKATASPSNSSVSEGSGVLVSTSLHSTVPEEEPIKHTSSDMNKLSPVKEPATNTKISEETTKYLAALDDDEEDEWN